LLAARRIGGRSSWALDIAQRSSNWRPTSASTCTGRAWVLNPRPCERRSYTRSRGRRRAGQEAWPGGLPYPNLGLHPNRQFPYPLHAQRDRPLLRTERTRPPCLYAFYVLTEGEPRRILRRT